MAWSGPKTPRRVRDSKDQRPHGFAEGAIWSPISTAGSPVVPAPPIDTVELASWPPVEPSLFGRKSDGHRSRMQSMFLARGEDALADCELLEILLSFATPNDDITPIVNVLIARFGSFAAVLSAPQRDLLAIQGLAEQAVSAIKLIQTAALRMAKAEIINLPVLNNWDRLMDYLNAVLSREQVEQFRVLFLDSSNRLIADEHQAQGTVNYTPVYPREVLKRALELHATALILVHNHPSGDPTPSQDDIDMTRVVQAATEALAITLHDHVIIGNGRWLSLRKEGLI